MSKSIIQPLSKKPKESSNDRVDINVFVAKGFQEKLLQTKEQNNNYYYVLKEVNFINPVIHINEINDFSQYLLLMLMDKVKLFNNYPLRINIEISKDLIFGLHKSHLFIETILFIQEEIKKKNCSNIEIMIYTDNPDILIAAKAIYNKNYKIQPKILIVDLHNLLYRLYYATEKTKEFFEHYKYGLVPNNLLMSFEKTLEWIESSDYTHVFFASEGNGDFRKSIDTKFFKRKITDQEPKERLDKPEDLLIQIKIVEENLKKRLYPVLKECNYEADDIIASLVNLILKYDKNPDITIMSTDKDLIQLLQYPGVKIWDPKKQEFYTEEKNPITEKYGIKPEQFHFFQSLTGDSADNILGIPGIGPIKAAKIVKEAENFHSFVANISRYGFGNKELSEVILAYGLTALEKNIFEDFSKKHQIQILQSGKRNFLNIFN